MIESTSPAAPLRGAWASTMGAGVTPASLLLVSAIVLLVFLPNRFNVGWGWEAGGWDFFPTDVLIPFLLITAAVFRTGEPAGGRLRPTLAPLVFLWFALGVVPTLGSEAAPDAIQRGLYALLAIALWTTPLLVVPSLHLSRRELSVVFIAFGALAAAGALLGLMQSLAPRFIYQLMGWKYVVVALDSERRGVLPLGPASVIGAYYAMVIPPAYVLLVSSRSGRMRLLAGGVILVLGLGCLFTSSRSTFGLLMLVLLGCFFWIRTRRTSQWVPIGAIALLAVVLAFLLMSLNFERLGTLQDASTAWRWRGVEAAVEMTAEKPWLGHGVESHFKRQEGDFRTAFVGTKAHEAILYNGRVAPYEPHNLYLFMAAERGLIGLGIFLLLLLVVLRWLFRYQSAAAVDQDRLWMRAFTVGFAAVLIHSLTGSDLIRQARLTPLFWIYVGLAICFGKQILTDRIRLEDQGRSGNAA